MCKCPSCGAILLEASDAASHGVLVDAARGLVLFRGRESAPLQAQEVKLLRLFLASPGRVLTKPYLFDGLYAGAAHQPQPKVLDVLLCRLRAKLKAIGLTLKTRHRNGVEFLIPASEVGSI